MAVFKIPHFSKIKNNSNAHIVISYDANQEDSVTYDVENSKKDYQVFFLNDELFIENKSLNTSLLTIHINKKHLYQIDSTHGGTMEIKNNVAIDLINLSGQAKVLADGTSIKKINSQGASVFEANKLLDSTDIRTSDHALVSIMTIETDKLNIEHLSDSNFQILSGNIESLIAENQSEKAHLKIDAEVQNADLLNLNSGVISANHINKSLTATVNSYGGIEANGQCEDFVHIQNNGNNYISLSNLNSQRVHFLNNADSHVSLEGKTEKLFYYSKNCSVGSFHDLVCSVADISLDSGSKVEVNVTEGIETKLSHGSFLNILSSDNLQFKKVNADEDSEFLIGKNLNLSVPLISYAPAKIAIKDSILAMRENLSITEKTLAFFKK